MVQIIIPNGLLIVVVAVAALMEPPVLQVLQVLEELQVLLVVTVVMVPRELLVLLAQVCHLAV
jgi:hypothetical protein